MKQPSIEQLILANGTRGIERLARYLPPDYAAGAARALWKSQRVLITTGFYVEGHPETDGPPGAFFLGRALAQLGASVSFVAEQGVLDLLRALADDLWRPFPGPDITANPDFVEFPVIDAAASRSLAREIIVTKQPTALVAIERCGRTASDHYRNVHGTDISQWNARVDDLFTAPDGYPNIVTIGVGDGGNEVGMGTLAEYIPGELGITDPVETRVDHLVPAAVSNWGAYGIIAYLSAPAGRDLLPSSTEEANALAIINALGSIDGLTHRAEPTVDGFPLKATTDLLAALREQLH